MSAGGVSLSRKPLAPARSARSTYVVGVEGGQHDDLAARPGGRAGCSVAVEPVHPGIRMSIRTTSGAARATAAGDLGAVGRLADELDVAGRRRGSSQRRRAPARRRRRPARAPGARRRSRGQRRLVRRPARAARRAAGSRRPASSRARARPPARPTRSREPDQPGAAAGQGSGWLAPTGGGLRTSTSSPRAGAPLTIARRRPRRARACARWSAPPARCGRRCGRPPPGTRRGVGRPGRPRRTRMPGAARLLHQRGQVGQRRLRARAALRRRRPRAARRSPRAGPPAPGGRSSRITPAARATSPAGASGRNSRAPACMLSSETRCASTSCISRAIRVRSSCRACRPAAAARPRPAARVPAARRPAAGGPARTSPRRRPRRSSTTPMARRAPRAAPGRAGTQAGRRRRGDVGGADRDHRSASGRCTATVNSAISTAAPAMSASRPTQQRERDGDRPAAAHHSASSDSARRRGRRTSAPGQPRPCRRRHRDATTGDATTRTNDGVDRQSRATLRGGRSRTSAMRRSAAA